MDGERWLMDGEREGIIVLFDLRWLCKVLWRHYIHTYIIIVPRYNLQKAEEKDSKVP